MNYIIRWLRPISRWWIQINTLRGWWLGLRISYFISPTMSYICHVYTAWLLFSDNSRNYVYDQCLFYFLNYFSCYIFLQWRQALQYTKDALTRLIHSVTYVGISRQFHSTEHLLPSWKLLTVAILTGKLEIRINISF